MSNLLDVNWVMIEGVEHVEITAEEFDELEATSMDDLALDMEMLATQVEDDMFVEAQHNRSHRRMMQ
ncbi:MAG: hypothetical protein HRT93_03230 [Piscirickettsiaceae bacterium]|nr:hypothetical protein [Piscirickettsiaceae bacterium]